VRTRIVRPPQSFSAIKASQVTLECGVESDASVLVSWYWFVDDDKVSSLSGSRMSVSPADGSLTIKSVRNTDIGRYTCHVVSVAGNDSASADLEVIGMLVLRFYFTYFYFCADVNLYVTKLKVADVSMFILLLVAQPARLWQCCVRCDIVAAIAVFDFVLVRSLFRFCDNNVLYCMIV